MKALGLAAGSSAAAIVAALGIMGVASAPQDAAKAADSASNGLIRVDDFMLADQNFLPHQLYRMADDQAVVLVTFDSHTRPDAAAIAVLKAAKGTEVFLLDSTLHDSRPAVAAALKASGVEAPVLFDYEQLVGEQLKVTRAGEAIVIDPGKWRIVYRGPLSEGGHAYAADAVAALSAGKIPAVSARPVEGPAIAFPDRAKAGDFAHISYTETIAPIIQTKCAVCHQPGGIGPMPLTSYEKVKAFSPMIREVIRTQRMPPNFLDETVGHFADDDRLTPEQKRTLVHWVEAGAPRGQGPDPLAKIKFQAPDWPLGKPDAIIDVPAVQIPASGIMEYQRPVVKNVMTEGRWMKATTFRVSDRQVVHHILSGVIEGDGGATKTAAETEWGASLGGYGPGRGSNIAPQDMGTWVPPSGGIAFQNHYTPYGKATTEKTEMGLYFYPKGQEPKYVLRTFGIFDFNIEIPPHEEFHPEISYIAFPHDAVLYGITPHAHHRGRANTVSIRYADGHEEMLLALPKYDFNWQYEYFLKTPKLIPAGSKIVTRWIYDNSTRNPDNPDPTKMVHWGEQSTEEMLATYLHYRWVGETVKEQHPEWEKALQGNLLFGVLDTNLDGVLDKSELKGKAGEALLKYFAIIDKNHDGVIDPSEMEAAQKLLPSRRQQAAGAKPTPAPAPTPAATAPIPPASPTR